MESKSIENNQSSPRRKVCTAESPPTSPGRPEQQTIKFNKTHVHKTWKSTFVMAVDYPSFNDSILGIYEAHHDRDHSAGRRTVDESLCDGQTSRFEWFRPMFVPYSAVRNTLHFNSWLKCPCDHHYDRDSRTQDATRIYEFTFLFYVPVARALRLCELGALVIEFSTGIHRPVCRPPSIPSPTCSFGRSCGSIVRSFKCLNAVIIVVFCFEQINSKIDLKKSTKHRFPPV